MGAFYRWVLSADGCEAIVNFSPKDEVRRPKGPTVRSQGSEGIILLVVIHIYPVEVEKWSSSTKNNLQENLNIEPVFRSLAQALTPARQPRWNHRQQFLDNHYHHHHRRHHHHHYHHHRRHHHHHYHCTRQLAGWRVVGQHQHRLRLQIERQTRSWWCILFWCSLKTSLSAWN